jgi:hypothetical protein
MANLSLNTALIGFLFFLSQVSNPPCVIWIHPSKKLLRLKFTSQGLIWEGLTVRQREAAGVVVWWLGWGG